jgi:hypothetical protein
LIKKEDTKSDVQREIEARSYLNQHNLMENSAVVLNVSKKISKAGLQFDRTSKPHFKMRIIQNSQKNICLLDSNRK